MPEAAGPPAALQYLGFDPGRRRIGVASANTVIGRAQGVATLDASRAAGWAAIDRLIGEWRPDALIVGVPRHPDGAPHANTRHALRFARSLSERYRLPVHPVDERYSTVEAQREGGPGVTPGGGSGIDARAAAVILEQFLAHPTPPMASTASPS